jgi:hypothetical protein
MEPKDNNKEPMKYSPEQIEHLKIIQDFNNKKANSHATIFVASMFALFTVLSLATRVMEPISVKPPNYLVLSLCSISYFLILLFGMYAALNFTYYSTISQNAEEAIVCGFDRQFINKSMKDWRGTVKIFAKFKVPIKGQGWLRRKLDWIIIIGYLMSGILPFIAFIIWFFS